MNRPYEYDGDRTINRNFIQYITSFGQMQTGS